MEVKFDLGSAGARCLNGGDGKVFTEYEFLKHSGVKGQRWGIRRYQNKDGTLTELGKAHYGKKSESGSTRWDKVKASVKKKTAAAKAKRAEKKAAAKTKRAEEKAAKAKRKAETTPTKVDVKKMTDDELQKVLRRIEAERKYEQYMNPKKETNEFTKRMSAVALDNVQKVINRGFDSWLDKKYGKDKNNNDNNNNNNNNNNNFEKGRSITAKDFADLMGRDMSTWSTQDYINMNAFRDAQKKYNDGISSSSNSSSSSSGSSGSSGSSRSSGSSGSSSGSGNTRRRRRSNGNS